MRSGNKIFERQGYHLLGYVGLAIALYFAARTWGDAERRVWGLGASRWIVISWILAGLSQLWIAFFWRMELHHGKISAWMGERGFLVGKIGFLALVLPRMFMVVPVSLSTMNTSPIPRALSLALIVVSTPFILWTMYCGAVYLGFDRGAGGDHFDQKYRQGFEKRGIFKYVRNPLYAVLGLALYHPGLLWQSTLGLVTAAAHHGMVWLHYFCTEKPDLKEIYGGTTLGEQ